LVWTGKFRFIRMGRYLSLLKNPPDVTAKIGFNTNASSAESMGEFVRLREPA